MIWRLTVGKILVAACPASLENEGPVSGLALLGELLASLHFERRRLHVGETFSSPGDKRRKVLSFFASTLSIWAVPTGGSPDDQRCGSRLERFRGCRFPPCWHAPLVLNRITPDLRTEVRNRTRAIP